MGDRATLSKCDPPVEAVLFWFLAEVSRASSSGATKVENTCDASRDEASRSYAHVSMMSEQKYLRGLAQLREQLKRRPSSLIVEVDQYIITYEREGLRG